MGVERTVTLWYLHRQLLLNELASLEAQLVQIPATSDSELVSPVPLPKELIDVEQQYKRTQEMLRALGPCPRPMMG
jgi:hypothetical protein